MGMTIEPAQGAVVIRAGGAVLGESRNAVALREDGRDVVFYLPRDDFSVAFLDPSDTATHCPLKGEARYFHIVAKSGPIRDAVWSYEEPLPAAEAIRGRLAFDREKVAVELLR